MPQFRDDSFLSEFKGGVREDWIVELPKSSGRCSVRSIGQMQAGRMPWQSGRSQVSAKSPNLQQLFMQVPRPLSVVSSIVTINRAPFITLRRLSASCGVRYEEQRVEAGRREEIRAGREVNGEAIEARAVKAAHQRQQLSCEA